jgi:hypothetical protein
MIFPAPRRSKAVVEPLIAGKKTVAEKEAAIVDYLDREVRYTGIEFGEAAIVPHDPAETLAKKYGDCKDKATLLVAMLRAAGIPAIRGAAQRRIADGCARRSAGHGNVRSRHRLCAREKSAVDRRHRPLRATGPVADGRPGAAGADYQRRRRRRSSRRRSPLQRTTAEGDARVHAADNGPANVVEITSPRASTSRATAATTPTSPTRTRARPARICAGGICFDDLTKVDRTDPADLSRPFELTIACEKAKRGYTNLEQRAGRHSRRPAVPDAARRAEAQGRQRREEDDRTTDKPKKPRTADWWLNAPYNAEWNYRSHPARRIHSQGAAQGRDDPDWPGAADGKFFPPARTAWCWRT